MKEPLLTFPILIMTILAFVAFAAGNYNINDLSFAVFLFFTVGAIVAAAASFNLVGSGLNAGGTSIVFQVAALLAMWGCFTFLNGRYLIFGGGIGSAVYAIMTIMFTVGSILHIRGAGI